MLPCTTQRRITTNLKSVNSQKRQKIKLHGTPTTKELKKKSTRTTRPVRRYRLGWLTQKNGSDPQTLGVGLAAELGKLLGWDDLRELRGGC